MLLAQIQDDEAVSVLGHLGLNKVDSKPAPTVDSIKDIILEIYCKTSTDRFFVELHENEEYYLVFSHIGGYRSLKLNQTHLVSLLLKYGK